MFAAVLAVHYKANPTKIGNSVALTFSSVYSNGIIKKRC